MLPAAHRMRHASDFSTTVRRGRRVRRGSVVIHHLPDLHPDAPARVGFVVSGAVGGSVVRHRVTRRLRHLARGRLDHLPEGSGTVVRALPDAADAPQLGRDVAAAFDAVATSRSPR